MSPEEMLDALSNEGDNAGADYNDGLSGWFGWDVIEVRNSASGAHLRNILTVTFQQEGAPDVKFSWVLQPANPQPNTQEK